MDGGVEGSAVAGDEVGGAGGLVGVVREFDGGDAVGAGEFADERDGVEGFLTGGRAAGVAVAKVVGEEGAPAGGETDAAVEVVVEVDDGGGVEAVGGDEALGARILAALEEPGDVFVAGEKGIFGVGALTGPVGYPVGCAFEELGGAEGVGQKDEELVVVALTPEFEDFVLRGAEVFVGAARGQGGHGHGEFVGVGADGFEIVLVGEGGVGGAGETLVVIGVERGGEGLDAVLLPEEAMATAGAEVGEVEAFDLAKLLDLVPETGLGAGVEDVEFELVEGGEGGAGLHLGDDGEGVDLP